MKVDKVEYVGSYHKEELCPKDGKPEFAFIGRSNVGKSSLINMLIDRKDLARVSKQPGKTQSLNFFIVNDEWYLVDLPGYGYARTSLTNRANWEKMIRNYLINRDTLITAFILLDSRHPLQKIDKEFINWCGESSVPFNIVYTKTDKVRNNKTDSNIEVIRQGLLEDWEELPQEFITSAEQKIGKSNMLEFIDVTLKSLI